MAKSFKKNKNKNKKGKVVGLIVGLLLGATIIAGVVCYLKVPAFKEWLSNGGQEIVNFFKKK